MTMAVKSMYALYDKGIQVFLNPIHFQNDGEAFRWFTTIVNDKNDTNISLYPDQFILFRLADYDENSGQFICVYNDEKDLPKRLVNGADLVDKRMREKYELEDIKKMVQEAIRK